MSKICPQMSDPMNLVLASTLGAYNAVEDILRNNLEDVNTVNSSGWTPVMYASNYGHFNIIRLLIRYGCDVNHRDWQGRTALMLAASNGHTRCIDTLLNVGKADLTLKDLSGTDAYKYAKNCGHGNNKLIRSLLLRSNGYELKGRVYNNGDSSHMMTSTPRGCDKSLAPILNASLSTRDDIYNPCKETPFSNSLSKNGKFNDVHSSTSEPFFAEERDSLKRKIEELELKIEELINTKN